MRMRSKFFTLLELLIVIAIIGILASLLLPALKTARESAKTIQCAGNMKQFGLAFNMYVNDNGSYMPPAIYSGYWWPDLWYKDKYLPDPHVFICPSTKAVDYIWSGYPAFGSNYKYNCRMGLSGFYSPGIISNIKYPARITVLADGQVGSGNTLRYDIDTNTYTSYDTYYGPALNLLDQRHNGGVNLFFVDGHVNKNKIKCDAVTSFAVWRPQ